MPLLWGARIARPFSVTLLLIFVKNQRPKDAQLTLVHNNHCFKKVSMKQFYNSFDLFIIYLINLLYISGYCLGKTSIYFLSNLILISQVFFDFWLAPRLIREDAPITHSQIIERIAIFKTYFCPKYVWIRSLDLRKLQKSTKYLKIIWNFPADEAQHVEMHVFSRMWLILSFYCVMLHRIY